MRIASRLAVSRALRLALACGLLIVAGGRLEAQSSAPVSGQPAATTTTPDPLDQAERSVVRVVAISVDQNDTIQDVSMGSGFAVANGKVVTNNHVVAGASGTTVHVFIIPERDAGGKAEPVTVERTSASADLALINAPELHAPPLKIAIPLPEKNATVHALGYPGITDQMRNLPVEEILSPAEPYVTQGSIALLSKTAPGGGQFETIFHTAAISSGNSGGPLVDECGRVIGVNAWTDSGRVNPDGTVSAPEGQSAAIRSTVLAQFLASEGIAPDQAVCTPPISAAIEARFAAEDAAIAREASLRADAESKLAAQAARDHTIALLALVVLALAIGGVALALVSQRRAPATAPAATAALRPDSPASPDAAHAPAPARPAPRIPAVAFAMAGAIVVTAAIAYAVVKLHPAATLPPPPSGAPSSLSVVASQAAASSASAAAAVVSGQPPLGPGTLVKCTLASVEGAPFQPDQITFSFDAQSACVDGRTGYSTAPRGFVRYVVSGMQPLMVRNTISADLRSFTQEGYVLSADQWASWRQASGGQRRCDAPKSDESSLWTPGGPLAGVMSQIPQQPTTTKRWTCTPG